MLKQGLGWTKPFEIKIVINIKNSTLMEKKNRLIIMNSNTQVMLRIKNGF